LLGSPHRELILAPPQINFIDFRQIEANFKQILTEIVTNYEIYVQAIQGRHFLRKKNPAGTLHNLAKGLVPLFAAICRYLPLIDCSFAAICR
jgi:hypothetical protein